MSRYRVILQGMALGLLIWGLHDLAHLLVGRQTLQDWYDTVFGREDMVDFVVFTLIGVGLTVGRAARQQSEEQLRKLSRAVQQSPSTVIITDLDGKIEYVNPKFTEVTGYSLDEVRGKNPRFLKSGETPSSEYAQLWTTIANGGEWRGELHNVKKNGELYWESASMSAIRNANGEITHYLGVKEDITARKEVEAAEREQRALAEALRQTAAVVNSTLELDEVLSRILVNLEAVLPHDGAYIMMIEDDTAHVVRTCSHVDSARQENLLAARFPVEETPLLQRMVGTGQPLLIEDVGTGADAGFPQEPMRSYLGAPIKHEGNVVGFLNLESATPRFYTSKQIGHIQAFADAVGIAVQNARLYEAMRRYASEMEQVVVERTHELREQSIHLQTILNSMGEGVMYLDQANEITYLNRAMLQIVGWELNQTLDFHEFRQWLNQYIDFPKFWADMQAAFHEKRHWQTEQRLAHRERGSFDAMMSYAPVFDEADKLVGRVALVRDVSQEKALQAQKERFLSYAAHELRTPISNIKTRLYLLRRQPEKLAAHLDVMDKVVADMMRLTEDLLDVVRFSHEGIDLEQGPLRLDVLVRDIIPRYQQMALQQNVLLTYTVDDKALPFCGDEQRIKQAVGILLESALAYCPEGERVGVDLAGNATHGTLRVSYGGPAMDVQGDEVFEPFFRLPGGGSGLGLTLAQEIIRLHGGRIEAKQGNVFCVQLALDYACVET